MASFVACTASISFLYDSVSLLVVSFSHVELFNSRVELIVKGHIVHVGVVETSQHLGGGDKGEKSASEGFHIFCFIILKF